MFDVAGINIMTHKVSLVAEKKTSDNAEEIAHLAQDYTEDEFFILVPVGTYKEGDTWLI